MTDDIVYSSRVDMDNACMVLAVLFARLRSKDPRTQVGCCIFDPKSGGIFLGYNGFPKGVPDLKKLWNARTEPCPDSNPPMTKYDVVVHAEANAVRKAMAALGSLDDCTLFVSHYPCHICMSTAIIPSGVKRVVYLDASQHYDPISAWLAACANVHVGAMDSVSDDLARLLTF